MEELELITKDLTEWTEEQILKVVRQRFEESRRELEEKKNTWVNYLKLYLNQERKKMGDLLVGSSLLYTQFNEIYSSIDNDDKRVEFRAMMPKDEDKIFYTNAVAKFDFNEMQMGSVQRELYWNTIFFGTGILDVSQYDTKRKITIARVQSPFTFFIDKFATSIEDARFAGRFIYKTYDELLQDSRLDPEKVKEIVRGYLPSSREKLEFEQRAKSIILQGIHAPESLDPLSYLEILEWYMYVNGKLWVIWTNSAISHLLGFEKVDYRDKGNRESKIPFVIYYFQKTPLGFWGTGLADALESYHRVMVFLNNAMLHGIKFDAIGQVIANRLILENPNDLKYKEFNKIIFTKAPPAGHIMPFPKTNVVSNEILAYYQMIVNEALGAAGASRILRGSLTSVKKSATEVAIAKAKQDMLLSSVLRNIIAGEKDFWYRWLKRHQRFMKEKDFKLIELVGYYGAKKFVEVSKNQFIPEVDPSIEIVSSLAAEPQKVVRRRDLAEILPVLSKMEGNVKYAVRLLLRDMDFSPEQIDLLLPPSPHQLQARKENELLSEGIWVDIGENDNDLEHIEEHYKITENEVVKAHIEAHLANYRRKFGIKGSVEKRGRVESEFIEEEPELESPEEASEELVREVPLEGLKTIVGNLMPQTPEEIK